MIKNTADKKKLEVAFKIRQWIVSKSNVSKFCRDNKFAKSTVDNWLSAKSGPSLQSAMRLEVISNGELTKEFLCPQYDW